MATSFTPSFVVGDTYQDRRGTYKVISVEGNCLIYDYGDGVPQKGDAERKWEIHRNILLAEQRPRHVANASQRMRSASDEEFWTYEEISPIFAEVIKAYGKKHKDFMTHEKIITAFMEHAEGKLILSRPHDDRPNLYWAGVMKAHFSRKYNSGTSEWDDCFEPKPSAEGYGYRARRVKWPK